MCRNRSIATENGVTNSPCSKEAISEVQYFLRISLVSISDFSSNRATRHACSHHSFFFSHSEGEFSLMKVQRDTRTRTGRAVRAACFDFFAIGSIIKISRTFHEGRALTSGTTLLLVLALWRWHFDFHLFSQSTVKTYDTLFAYFWYVARWSTRPICTTHDRHVLRWSSINHSLMSCTLFINRTLARQGVIKPKRIG